MSAIVTENKKWSCVLTMSSYLKDSEQLKRERQTLWESIDSVSPGDEKTDGHPQQDMNRGDLKTSWAPAACR